MGSEVIGANTVLELTVQGLYENIKQLQKGADTLKAENGNLRCHNEKLHLELERLAAENQQLKTRRSLSQRPACLQCSMDGVSCDRKEATCRRCKMQEMTCTSPEPEPGLSTRRPTLESGVTDQDEDLPHPPPINEDDFSGLRSGWFDFEDGPLTSELPDEASQTWSMPQFDENQTLTSKDDNSQYIKDAKAASNLVQVTLPSFPGVSMPSFPTVLRPRAEMGFDSDMSPHTAHTFLPMSYDRR